MRTTVILSLLIIAIVVPGTAVAAGGMLAITAQEESGESPTITRMELYRGGSPAGKPIPVSRAVSAGFGVVMDRNIECQLRDGAYSFRIIRGPEYRIVSGAFALEKTSQDRKTVRLPRMVEMLAKGWTSGDCCVVASSNSLPLRMASEDLHLATVLGHVDAKPIAGRDRDDPPKNDPAWIVEDATHHDGLVFYGPDVAAAKEDMLPGARLAALPIDDNQVRVAIEDPFAWPVPVWLASGRIDGVFILGDWLRLDRKVLAIKNGRNPPPPGFGGRTIGRWAEQIYWNMLEAGLRIPPLAGSGSEGRFTPVGYNRLYVGEPLDAYQEDGKLHVRRVGNEIGWWYAAWHGQSVATNGPLLSPKLSRQIPGHVFTANTGEVLELHPELTLWVRDEVDYLEVIHNGRVHYSARLDEYAKAGGMIPPIMVKESGWVTFRVVTLYEDHFRAAMTAPWYIDFDSKPRMTAAGVKFFRDWLAEYEARLKRLPPEDLAPHIPLVQSARRFWGERAAQVQAD